MPRLSKNAFAGLGGVLLSAAAVHAAPTVDGVLNVADGYGAPIAVYSDNYINGSSPSGGTNQVSTYWAYDNDYVYGVIHLDSGAAAFPGANVYVYSSTANTNLDTNSPGTYGDLNDVILNGNQGYGFALNSPPWESPTGGVGDPFNTYSPTTANYVFNGTDTVEFSIARSILGNYDSFRYGGQLFAYEFHTGGDRVDGAIAPVPEPASLGLLALGVLPLLQRRRAKTAH